MDDRWKVLLSVTALQLCAAAATQGFGSWGPYLQARLAFSHAELGVLASLAWGVTIPGLIVAGSLLDRFGERRTLAVGISLLVAGLVLLATADGMASAVAAMLLIGLGYSPVQPGGSKAVHLWFSARQRGLAMGLRQAALPFGGALTAYAFPKLLQAWGWHAAVLTGAGLIIAAGLAFCVLHRTPKEGDFDGRRGQPTSFASADRQRLPVAAIGLIGMVLVSAQTGLMAFWALSLVQAQQLSLEQGLALLTQVMLSGGCGRILLALWSDRPGMRRSTAVCAAALATAALFGVAALVPPGTPVGALSALSCAIGFVGFGWYGPWVAWLTEAAHPNAIGRVLGRAMAANQCAIALVPMLLGAWADAAGGYATAWWAFAALIVAALPAFWSMSARCSA